jgi:hypothetical protein
MNIITEIKKVRIPHGFYCYQTLKIVRDEKLGFKMKIRECPFYRDIHDVEGFCTLENCRINDSCKICGLNQLTELEKEGFR